MKISLNWLKKYVAIDVPVKELAEKLTMAGLEVESIEELGAKYDKFLVGRVVGVKQHPNADKLTVCTVSTGKEDLDIVCGAPNVAVGQKVPVGLVGATIPRNQHDPDGKPFVLERIQIRGVESNGMICSEYELGLGEDAEGILVLSESAKVGMPLAEHLGLTDTVLTIGLTPNRPDCLGHVGVAREVAAVLGLSLKETTVKVPETKERAEKWASVEIKNLEDCPRYTARVILGVKVRPSPQWLQDLLKSIGVRPVNNVVDITNYVLMELGHPLHAFDFEKLEGHKIVVRRAREGEGFTTLDGKVRTLRADTLMICDASGAVAIAGVMGGANTEILDSTENVLLESAYFSPRSIRRTSKYLTLSTDASQRFERGADPNVTRHAIDRCAELMQEICGGKVLKGVIDAYPKKIRPRRISIRTKRVNEVLGTDLTDREVVRILSGLELRYEGKAKKKRDSTLRFIVPTSRVDLEREIDLIEEVARVYGYDRIEDRMETVLKFPPRAVPIDLSDELRDALAAAGFREIVTNSLQKKSVASLSGVQFVEVINPISEDMAALRTSLVPGMLEIVRHNIDHGAKDLRLFEIGQVFRMATDQERGRFFKDYVEEERVIVALTGLAHAPGWDTAERPADLFDLKGDLQGLLEKIFLDKFRFIYYSTTNTLTEFSVNIEINGTYAGFLGKARNDIANSFGVEQEVYLAEISVDVFKSSPRQEIAYVPLPKFPSVGRDLAFIVDESVPVKDVEGAIRASGGELLTKVRLFDLYAGDQIQAGKKSCAFALEFLSRDRTLTEQEVERAVRTIVQHVTRELKATLRG